MKAASNCDAADETRERLRQLVSGEETGGFVTSVLGSQLGL
jgi:hypothetical protein